MDALLAEQVAYYRARAAEYDETVIPDVGVDVLSDTKRALLAAIEAFRPNGVVLELACGTGTWTPELLRYADHVTAVDASPEMLELARARADDERVRFVQADIFDWKPGRRYGVIFFGFRLSHVPLERFDEFWGRLADWLEPGGRVFFVDDDYRTPDELIEGEASSTVRRRLEDGRTFRAVKVAHTPADLERRLSQLGWNVTVTPAGGPFFWGAGGQA